MRDNLTDAIGHGDADKRTGLRSHWWRAAEPELQQ